MTREVVVEMVEGSWGEGLGAWHPSHQAARAPEVAAAMAATGGRHLPGP